MKRLVIPASYGKSWDRGDYVGIVRMSITYIQPADTNSSADETQTLTIETDVVCAPGLEEAKKKESFYFNISIDGHWSIDEPSEIASLIEDFKKRIYMNSDKEIDNLIKREEEYGNKQRPD